MSNDTKNKWEKFAQDQAEESQEAEQAVELEEETLGIAEESRQDLEDELNEADAEVSQYKDQLARLQADMQNQARRHEKSLQDAHKFATSKLLTDILPVVDSLRRGLEVEISADASAKSLCEGMQMTLDILLKTLTKHGVEEIRPASGDAFNPEVHEAMSMVPNPDAKPNSIMDVIQPGYSLNGRVIRAAMVIVVK